MLMIDKGDVIFLRVNQTNRELPPYQVCASYDSPSADIPFSLIPQYPSQQEIYVSQADTDLISDVKYF